ncbi:MAG: ATP-binding protein [Candidatus Pacebacteria bacterium]|nr:ATP-binding protein [Candidatus Paceibacterota bacterium]
MKLNFKEQYKSINKFNSIELEDFTVLTGVNGSGKSHLLEAIEQKKVIIAGFEDTNNIVHFNYETFRLENEGTFNAQQIASEKEGAWTFFEQQIKTNVLSWKNGLEENYKKIVDIAQNKEKSMWWLYKKDFSDDVLYNLFRDSYKKIIINHFKNKNFKNNQQAQALFSLIKTLPYSIDEITKEDFLDLYKPVDLKNDFLPTQIGKVIWDYHVKYRENLVNEYENEKHGTKNKILSEVDFEKVHGPKPWEIINEILEKFNTLDYTLKSPTGSNHLYQFQLKLLHTKNKGLEINFNELSSGEKILMALVVSIYKTSSDNLFPEILLLDEIDASLHPSMMQNLLDVINEIFLERGIKIILVTHSPTMIAFAPEKSIFVMEKSGQDRIKKKNGEEALSILTEGYATLDEGLKLFDQISKKEVSILTEGKNTEFIKKAADFFGKEQKDKIEIITGVEKDSGKNQLKTIFSFFSKVPHDKKVIFVWDCDVKQEVSSLVDTNNTFAYTFLKNNDNDKVTKGIENLFLKEKFEDKFYIEKPKDDGGVQKSLNKEKFKNYMIKNGVEKDFENFKPLFEKIKDIINK